MIDDCVGGSDGTSETWDIFLCVTRLTLQSTFEVVKKGFKKSRARSGDLEIFLRPAPFQISLQNSGEKPRTGPLLSHRHGEP